MVRHTQLASVTVTDGAKHCVTDRQWSQEVRVHFRFMFISNNREITNTDINIIQALRDKNSLNRVNKRALASNYLAIM